MFVRYFKYYINGGLQQKSVAGAVYVLFLLVMGLTACKKSSLELDDKPESPLVGTRTQLTLDSVFLYARQVYLWNASLPDYQTFNPRKYSSSPDEFQNLKNELFDISQYQINPSSQRPYEQTDFPGVSKYSLLVPGASGNDLLASVNPVVSATSFSFYVSGDTGYLKFTEFANLNELRPTLDNAFLTFANADVHNLIIDLRENSGGYIETAEYLANLMAIPEMNDKVMFSQHFNVQMQQGKAVILKNQPYLDENNQPVVFNGRKATYADIDFSVAGNTVKFEKKGHLMHLDSLVFIVNGNTASASELLINSLLPYFDVTLIGTRTYGKPVGSFGIKIDRYTLYVTNFQIKNSKGAGDYFDGMLPNVIATDKEIGTSAQEVVVNAFELIQQKDKTRAKATLSDATEKKRYEASNSVRKSSMMIKEKLRLKQYP